MMCDFELRCGSSGDLALAIPGRSCECPPADLLFELNVRDFELFKSLLNIFQGLSGPFFRMLGCLKVPFSTSARDLRNLDSQLNGPIQLHKKGQLGNTYLEDPNLFELRSLDSSCPFS